MTIETLNKAAAIRADFRDIDYAIEAMHKAKTLHDLTTAWFNLRVNAWDMPGFDEIIFDTKNTLIAGLIKKSDELKKQLAEI